MSPLGVRICMSATKRLRCDSRFPHVKMLPGARRLLDHLASHNVPLAIATSSSRASLQLKLQKHGDVQGLCQVCSCEWKGSITKAALSPTLRASAPAPAMQAQRRAMCAGCAFAAQGEPGTAG